MTHRGHPRSPDPPARAHSVWLVACAVLMALLACNLPNGPLRDMYDDVTNMSPLWLIVFSPPEASEGGAPGEVPSSPPPAAALPNPPVQSSGSPAGPLKPVGFVNHGTVAATVMAWTYVPLDSDTQATPSDASTVSFPPTAPDWPNSSRFLMLPLGTYTWCYQWELGDIDADSMIEYAHAIDNRRVLVDASAGDSTDNALQVDFNAPSASGQLAGRCGETPANAPPTIVSISFPSTIPGDRSQVLGTVTFTDPDGNINRQTNEVIAATEFESADYDPRPYLVSGNAMSGAYQLYIWCEGQQSVTLRTTLYDSAGAQSNSVDFSFTCR